MKRKLLALIVLVAGVIGGVAPPASAAGTVDIAVTGSVQCTSGKPVEGVWVNSSGGGSGWAGHLTGRDATVWYFRYPAAHGTFSTTPGSTISIHVGCGGTTGQWASDNWTDGVAASSSGNLVLNAYSCHPPNWVSGKTVRGACSLPPMGAHGATSPNPGVRGNCTCGAAYFWKKNGGIDATYPVWGGNAGVWASNAKAKGWTVANYPAQHAVLVHPTSGTDANPGHVGWVTSVNVVTGVITYIDMNSAHLGQYLSHTATVSDFKPGGKLAGDLFILRQPGYEWSWGTGAYPPPGECAV